MKMKMTLILIILFSFTPSFAKGRGGYSHEACLNKADGEVCSLNRKGRTINGRCMKDKNGDGYLFCKGDKRKKGPKGQRSYLNKLDLSKDQLQKMNAYMKDFNEKHSKLRSSNIDYRKSMSELFLAGESDQKFKELHAKVMKSRADEQNLRLEKMMFMKNLFTEKQRKIYIESRYHGRGRR